MALHSLGFGQYLGRSGPLRTIAACCFYCSNLLLARVLPRPVVLCFHRIKEPSASVLDRRVGVTRPDALERAVRYIGMLGYRFVSLEHLMESISSSKPGRLAAITFDDGFRDLYQNAYPILKKRNIPFTLFLITGTVDSKRLLRLHKRYVSPDGTSPAEGCRSEELAASAVSTARLSAEDEQRLAEELYLTRVELSEMEMHGLSVEAHGHEHVRLADASELETEKEISDSVQFIARELRRRPLFYSLPYGAGNRFVRDIAKALSLQGIFTTRPRLVRPHEDAYDLPRICISGDSATLYIELARAYLDALMDRLRGRTS